MREDTKIVIGGKEISLLQEGEGEPLVMLHGYLSCKESFYHQIRFFSQYYRVTAFDFVGMGKSSQLCEPWSVDDYCANTLEILDALGIGKCRFCLAGKVGENFYDGYNVKRIATKYPNVTKAYFESKGMDVKIVKIEGSVELAPLLGLSDAIVDIVETGTTLKENGLEVYETLFPISARVIVNTASMKLRRAEIDTFVAGIEKAKQEAGK